jgi:hypothetical protein
MAIDPTSDTVQATVEAIAPELVGADPILFGIILDDVKIIIKKENWKNNTERAQRYLVAHLMTLSNANNKLKNAGSLGGVESQKVGDVEISYGAIDINDKSRFDETSYGRVFNQIQKQTFPSVFSVKPG